MYQDLREGKKEISFHGLKGNKKNKIHNKNRGERKSLLNFLSFESTSSCQHFITWREKLFYHLTLEKCDRGT